MTTVHQPFDPRIFYKQLGSLREAGFDVHLIAPHARSECTKGIEIHALPKPANRWQRLRLQSTVFRKARLLEADLYQFHDPELIPLALLLKKSTETPVVYDMHEDYRSKGSVEGRILRFLEHWGFRWIDHVFLAEKSYRSIVEGREVDHTYIANYFKPIGEEDQGKTEARNEEARRPSRLLYTGTVSDRRGLRTMLDLASAIRNREREETLDIVGICRFPEQRAVAEERIRKERLDSVVNRVGWDTYVSPEAMPPYYWRADFGLTLCEPHSNVVGSMPTKFYEYLYYGLPIICSDFPLWREFIEEHECGQVVPPGDAEAVLEVVEAWRRHPERYRRCVENAREAAQQYRWEKMGDRLVRVYRTLLNLRD